MDFKDFYKESIRIREEAADKWQRRAFCALFIALVGWLVALIIVIQ